MPASDDKFQQRGEGEITTPPPPQPPAGWYPDPTGNPGEMYWDGEAWHRLAPDVAATPQSDLPATSAAGTSPPPPLDLRAGLQLPPLITVLGIGLLVVGFLLAIPILWTVGLVVLVVGLVLMAVRRWGSATPKAADETRSGNKIAALMIGGFLLIVAGLWFVAYPLGVVAKLHAPSSPAPGSPGSQQSQSPYYQEGYNSGTSGLARKGYGDDMYNTGATVAEMEHNACSRAINNESNLASIQDADHPANQDDYMRGCLDAFRDHPPTGKPKPGPLNPYR